MNFSIFKIRGMGPRIIVPTVFLFITASAMLLGLHYWSMEKTNAENAKEQATMLFQTVLKAIDHPMRQGDDIRVQKIVEEFQDEAVIYITNEKNLITYSPNKGDRDKTIDRFFKEDFLKKLNEHNSSGTSDKRLISTISTEDGAYLVGYEQINNHKDCYHCHGSSKPVLGALLVKRDITKLVKLEEKSNRIILAIATFVTFIIIVILVSILKFIAINPIKKVAKKMQELTSGDADLTRELEVQAIDCAAEMDCSKPDCPSYGKETHCWQESGSFAAEIHCPKISSGEYSSCEVCSVYKKALPTEIDEVATFVNAFTGRIRTLIARVVSNAEEVGKEAEKLINDSREMADSSRLTEQQSESSMHKTEDTSDVVSNLAAAMEEMTATINEIARNAGEAREKSQDAQNDASSATDIIRRLADASAQIGTVSSLIGSIADQTNLLALNATIEAARAGEAGKGFAVVANEVKELAKQTASSVNEIDQIVKTLQNESDNVNHAVSKISEVIENVLDYNDSIAAAIEEQTATASEISSNAQTARDNINEVQEASKNIALESVKNTEGATRVEKSATRLNDLFHDLHNLLNEFKI